MYDEIVAKINTKWARTKWLPALKSGLYRQTTGRMFRNFMESQIPQMCCLGVACDVLDPEGWHEADGEISWGDVYHEFSEDGKWQFREETDVENSTCDNMPVGTLADMINFGIEWDWDAMKAKAGEFIIVDYVAHVVDLLAQVNDVSDSYANTIAVIEAGLGISS